MSSRDITRVYGQSFRGTNVDRDGATSHQSGDHQGQEDKARSRSNIQLPKYDQIGKNI